MSLHLGDRLQQSNTKLIIALLKFLSYCRFEAPREFLVILLRPAVSSILEDCNTARVVCQIS